ncbi:hypothetical protein FD754_012653 [Muntiacus muntjak]|uniref:Disrupted in schizophrenia 1 protein n=1 Tax=Muntiacus muntjak TaxID=9888 RepID=A0A5N3VI65_MUNMU|nr:hypothetical protein FD754_012653 [Muntiacus muntjak]
MPGARHRAKCFQQQEKSIFKELSFKFWGFPGGASGKESACPCRRYKRPSFSLWVGKITFLPMQEMQEMQIRSLAETIQQRLEALEKERSSLHFQLPSRQPALSGLLGHLGAQARASLRRAAQRAGGDDPQARLRMDPQMSEAAAQDSLRVSITRRDWLLQEKQQLQKEIETLQARMSVLEAKDQQLRREIEEQERLLPWQGCDLVGGLSLGELQEVTKTLQDTLALAEQIPLHTEPPETIRSERLCSALRKKVNDIETQLPALFEAKMLAISGSHFCTAKELTEEIRSLTLEREGLEGLLHKLLVLSSRNVQKLGSVKEAYSRLRQELDQGRTAYVVQINCINLLRSWDCVCVHTPLPFSWELEVVGRQSSYTVNHIS